jgi:peroxiredoxin
MNLRLGSFFVLGCALSLSIFGCATAHVDRVAPRSVPDAQGAEVPLIDPHARATVLEFFSAHCPCQTAHDARLRGLASTYGAQGIAFRAVSSEASLDRRGEAEEAAKRRYPYPLVHDQGGALARSVGAEYATYTLVVAPDGRVLFRGGIDSDKRDLHDDARPYLGDALADILAGRPVARPEAKTLGCALQVN